MKRKALNLFEGTVLSRWWIYFIDILLCSLCFLMAYVIRLNFHLPHIAFLEFFKAGLISVFTYALTFLLFRTYKGVIRHTEFGELMRITYSSMFAAVLLFGVNKLNTLFAESLVQIPRLVIVLHFIFCAFILGGFRILVRETYSFLTKRSTEKNVYIYGAGSLGLIAFDAIKKDKKENYKVVGFIDDDCRKHKNYLRDVKIISFNKACRKKDNLDVSIIVLAIANLSKEKIRSITDQCLKHQIEVKILPSFKNWMQEQVVESKIRKLKIEDLLGRDEIQLDLERISTGLQNKVVLVSGAAGSIGSEMVRQLVKYPLQKLILLDQAESALYDLQQELIASDVQCSYELIVADISNERRIKKVFNNYRPQVVINAAAYKHVPLMEENPYEAINVNVRGTKILADLSIEYLVEKFVMVSTDKAVNPTNVMGASKRLCEIYIQALAQNITTDTSFITTRFGNVLGSNGSVVPLFHKQIENGGPITVTHPDITRYFMTIPEACQLVLEAGFMGEGGEIFVFDMGQPVKIADLAKRMISLSGLKLDEDIYIKYTGLRPGEKLYEELLATKENTKPTHNDKIMIASVRHHDFKIVEQKIDDLLVKLNYESNQEIVSRMKELIPEFISQNSDFEALDV